VRKTRKFEIEEAYAQGWNEAAEYYQENIERLEQWMRRPEFPLAVALNTFIADVFKEATGKKDFNAKI
jgi:hypothetical protein